MFSVAQLALEIERRSKGRLKSVLSEQALGVEVVGFSTLEAAGSEHVAFLAQSQYREQARQCRAGALVLTAADRQAIFGDAPAQRALVETNNPYAWFAWALQIMTQQPTPAGSVSPTACVDASAQVASSAVIESGAVVSCGAVIGERVHLFPGVFVGANATVGEDSILYPNAVVYHGCRLGARVILHSGCVIGADGFGFAPFAGEWVKIPQIGAVTIGDDVEVGANTTIDRGALEDTVVGQGTKLDNLIQLGHNDRVGEHTVMAACTGVAGSTSIGSHCMVGGAANINGHIRIPDCSVIGPASTILHWDPKARQMMGVFPAQEQRAYEKTAVLVRRLTTMREQIRSLEQEIEQLKAKN